MEKRGKSHPDCINSSNPYHECVEYCFKRIAEAKAREEEEINNNVEKEPKERMVHPSCINAANPYHECSEFCFKKIADAKELVEKDVSDIQQKAGSSQLEYESVQNDGDNVSHDQDAAELGNTKLTDKWDKMAKLKQRLLEAKKANQMAMVVEKKKMEAPAESRGISKQKWLDERKKKIGKLLDSNGLDMQKVYMLDTQEMAETKYKKWEKEPAPYGWDVFNQKTLYNAHKKRTKNIEVDMDSYNKSKEDDPEFYRDASSLQYGKISKLPEENIDRMVKELQDREAKKKSFSRRRKFHEEKDIDAINDRNEHFNKKIERAFGKYTLEIKNNLERGTALPD